MKKNHLTLADLKKQGLKLSKTDAQELHHHVSRIAQHGSDEDVIFGEEDEDESQQHDESKAAKGHKKAKASEIADDDQSNDDQGDLASDEDNEDTEDNTDQSNEENDTTDGKLSFQLPVAGEHHASKKKRQKEQGLMDHVVTQEDLDNNAPDLEAAGVKVGDTIQIPVTE